MGGSLGKVGRAFGTLPGTSAQSVKVKSQRKHTVISDKEDDAVRTADTSWLISDRMNTILIKLQEIVKDRKAWHAAVHGVQRVRHDLATEQQK